MNTRTSIYLHPVRKARIEASGLSAGALVDRGLDSLESRRRDEVRALTAEIRELRNEVRAVLRRLQ